MPYGFPKELGGDTPETDAKIERCVERNVSRGYSKQSAIAICKRSIEDAMRRRGNGGGNKS
jgi:hypothetical protein